MSVADSPFPDNAAFAANLGEYADVLSQQDADGFRMAAYRRAADIIGSLARRVIEILATEGRDGLTELPGIGSSIVSALAEMAATGRWSRLERVLEPEKLFQTIPGIGGELAGRLSEQLHVETLEALELAAHDGRLERLEGFGPRRAQMVRIALAERLGRPRFRRMRQSQSLPPVSVLLDIDREYREKAAAGSLLENSAQEVQP